MFIDKDEKVKISLEEYFRKYPNASFYGLQNGEEAYGSGKISLPILEKVNGKENIDVVIGNGEVVTINLYYMTKMRHSKSEELEYIIEHNIYSRDGFEGEFKSTGKGAGIKIPFKTDYNGKLQAPSITLNNFIYKFFDRYGKFLKVKEGNELPEFEKLVIKSKDGETIFSHDGKLKTNELVYDEASKSYKINFIETKEDDWHEFIYDIQEAEPKQKIKEMYYLLKPEKGNIDRNIKFEYYFNVDPVPEFPDVELLTKYTIRHLDQDGNAIFTNKETAFVGDSIEVEGTRLELMDYKYYDTKPNIKSLKLVKDESQNIITHYYYNKDTHILVRYHTEGGKFGKLENAYPGSDENTRIVLAKKTDLAKDHNPGDISKPGFAFVDWTNDKEGLEPIGDELVAGLGTTTENGVEYVDIYAQWREVVDPIVTFHANGGSFGDNTSTKTFTGKAGRTIGSYVPSGLRRSGYNFTKWTQGLNGNEMVESYVLQEKDDIHIYANWKLDDYVAPVDPPIRPPVGPPVSPPVGPEIIPGGEVKPPEDFELIEIIFPDIPLGNKLNMTDHFAYIFGYPNVTVRPENNITREEAAAVFYRLLRPSYKELIYSKDKIFKDVGETRWSFEDIASLNKGQIVSGYMDKTFRPKNNVTRSEIAVMASRFENLKYDGVNRFKDVENHWAKHHINSAAMNGWIVGGGSNGNFRPDDYMTRAEFVTMVNNVLKRKVRKENALEGIKKFSDLQEDKWYYEPMIEAINRHDYEKERLEDGSEIWIKLLD